jgi:hypothetical protein
LNNVAEISFAELNDARKSVRKHDIPVEFRDKTTSSKNNRPTFNYEDAEELTVTKNLVSEQSTSQ